MLISVYLNKTKTTYKKKMYCKLKLIVKFICL